MRTIGLGSGCLAWAACSGSGIAEDGWGASSDLPPTEETGVTFSDDSSTSSSYSTDYYSSSSTWVGQWGEVVFGGAGAIEEAYTGFVDWDGASTWCDVSYRLTEPVAASGCDGCTVAWTFVLGRGQVYADEDGQCAALGWLDLEGTSLTVGHVPPERLWLAVDGLWAAEGWSDASEQFWEFEIPF